MKYKTKERKPLPRCRQEIVERALVEMVRHRQAKAHTITMHLCINETKGIYENKEFTFFKIINQHENNKVKERV